MDSETQVVKDKIKSHLVAVVVLVSKGKELVIP